MGRRGVLSRAGDELLVQLQAAEKGSCDSSSSGDEESSVLTPPVFCVTHECFCACSTACNREYQARNYPIVVGKSDLGDLEVENHKCLVFTHTDCVH